MTAIIRERNQNVKVFATLICVVDMCEVTIAIKGCCAVHAGLPGTKSDQMAPVSGGKRAARRLAGMVAG
jgi:uncharacterized protein (DUF2126 family)